MDSYLSKPFTMSVLFALAMTITASVVLSIIPTSREFFPWLIELTVLIIVAGMFGVMLRKKIDHAVISSVASVVIGTLLLSLLDALHFDIHVIVSYVVNFIVYAGVFYLTQKFYSTTKLTQRTQIIATILFLTIFYVVATVVKTYISRLVQMP